MKTLHHMAFVTMLSLLLGIATASPLKTINLAYVKSPFNLQNMVMKERGMMEKEFATDGIVIRWRDINSGAKQVQGMASGALDVSAVMNTASILMTNSVGNAVYIASGVAHPAENFAIVGKAGKRLTIRALKGEKVAGPQGTVLHQLLVAALRREGLSITDVQYLPMSIPAAAAALTSGQISAALLPASAIIKAEEAGCHVITTAQGLVKVNLVLTARASFAREHPEALRRIVKVEREALAWIRANPEQALRIGMKEHGISRQEALKLASRSNFYDVLTEADIQGLEEDQAFLYENGMMRQKIDVRQIVLPSALK